MAREKLGTPGLKHWNRFVKRKIGNEDVLRTLRTTFEAKRLERKAWSCALAYGGGWPLCHGPPLRP